ncbi:hypothetical protein [Cellulomonas biazotea]|uniref:Lipoprotein n=1 Tax=Cellulomonas biazotea TaxID=1709 RepID=A0A402DPC5_9CELL|nr:hypothetical protein [Cellulomonas biazotea]GCE75980.1 hypothetical protein CBZ_10360 [Cellulomonas biazotea]
MPRPRRSAAPTGLTGLTALAVAALLAGCTTSTPATVAPSDSSTSTLSSTPVPTESLLPTDDATASAVGELAEGFPSTLVVVPDGAEVLVSSARPVEGSDLVEVSLNLRTVQDAAALLDAVRAPLLAAGFAESTPPAPEAGLAAQSTFSRADGSELLVVGILDRDGVRTLTLGGRVRPPTT